MKTRGNKKMELICVYLNPENIVSKTYKFDTVERTHI